MLCDRSVVEDGMQQLSILLPFLLLSTKLCQVLDEDCLVQYTMWLLELFAEHLQVSLAPLPKTDVLVSGSVLA
jgi:hypothetical protein